MMHSYSSHTWRVELVMKRNGVNYEGDAGWHGSGFCKK